MRIISDTHDYYDSVQKFGQDDQLIYHRKEKVVYFPGYSSGFYTRPNYHVSFAPSLYIIGFCGKIYPVVRIDATGSFLTPRRKYHESVKAFCYNVEEIDKFVEANYNEKQIAGYYSKGQKDGNYWIYGVRRFDFVKLFDKYKTNRDYKFDESPIFITRYRKNETEITYNGILKDFEFYRIFDPYSAFQELQMYLSNIAQPNRPIPAVSDEDMAAAKGFDKFSFRKDKKKK